ncbi:MAG: serine/threonine-protein kinase [Pseudomonadota bacterium]
MLRARQKLGKYRIVRRISRGPLATVYQAFDTVLGARVALKVPAGDMATLDDFIHEARVGNKLCHPNILPVRDAGYIDDRFVIVMALGEESLADRIERRISKKLAVSLACQALAAVSHAHRKRIIHCDIKPENFILFPDNQLKLCDFGFAKISLRTIKASGSGTIEYIAPEQAMGRPKPQSDVFSLGLVLCRLLGGRLPEWPFDWPPPGIERLQSWLPDPAVDVLQRAIRIDPKKRYTSAVAMERAFLSALQARKDKQKKGKRKTKSANGHWKRIQQREFRRRHGRALGAAYDCRKCSGPVSESMQHCPWCGVGNPSRHQGSAMPTVCPRCDRGSKREWLYCAYCYGPGFEPESTRRYQDKRYVARCASAGCRGPLMAYMRYCPWCRTKVKQSWKLPDSGTSCKHCGWGVAADFWDHCAWCGSGLKRVAVRTAGRHG